MWIGAVFLAYSYSTQPLRLKSRSWLAMISLLLVLSILPIFLYSKPLHLVWIFSFLFFLSGQALVVYGVIVPAEIRDYFGDKALGIKTLTVRLGLVKASVFSIILLVFGGLFCGIGFFLKLVSGIHPLLAALVFFMMIPFYEIFRQYWKLYKLSKEYIIVKEQVPVEEKVVNIAIKIPKWITLITQTIVLMSIALINSKFYP